MEKLSITPLLPDEARRLPQFKYMIGNVIKQQRDTDTDTTSYRWQLKNPTADVLATLIDFHFPITVQDNNVSLYDYSLGKSVDVLNSDTINAYLAFIKDAYKFSGGAKVSRDDLRTIHTFSSKHTQFATWDGQKRAFTILDEFFELDPNAIVTDLKDKTIANQMRLVFVTWAMQHVARLKGMGTLATGDIQYSLFPIILSNDKEIGKSSFLNHLLGTLGSKGETNLDTLLNPIQRGRLFSHHQALILNELSPFEVLKNIEKIKELATLDGYTVDEKFEKAVDLTRETALIATSNRPASDFSQHQSERRIQLITILRKDKPTQFEDYPFEQFWAELAWLVDSMPKRELKKQLRWGTQHTIQPDADDDNSLFEFMRQVGNKYMTQSSEFVHVVTDGRLIGRECFIDEVKTNRGVLDALGLNPQLDAKAGTYTFSDTKFMRRLRPYLIEFSRKTGQLVERNTKGKRGFLITEPVTTVVESKEEVDTGSLTDKWQTLGALYDNPDTRSGLHRQIADLPIWNGGFKLDETSPDANGLYTMNMLGMQYHLVVVEQKDISAPEYTPSEDIDDTTRLYFWLSDDNTQRLIANGSFDMASSGITIINGNATTLNTDAKWLNTIQPNVNIDWLLNYAHVVSLDKVQHEIIKGGK